MASEDALGPRDAWPTKVLSDHDQLRHRTRFGDSEARARVAAVVLLTLRGTPFLYAGEELGAQDAVVGEDERVDPSGRDRCRSPIPWSAGDGHGWSAKSWLPFESNAGHALRRCMVRGAGDGRRGPTSWDGALGPETAVLLPAAS